MAERHVVTVLVDYDNVSPSRKEHSADEVEINADIISDSLTRWISANLGPKVTEMNLRLYGGWLLANGTYSRRGHWLLSRLAAFRTRRNGIRVHPTLVVAVAEQCAMNLVGTLRSRHGNLEQKMVDMMIAVDFLHYRRMNSDYLVIASDDDDLVPAMIVGRNGANRSNSAFLLRHRDRMHALNDHHICRCGIEVRLLPTALRRS